MNSASYVIDGQWPRSEVLPGHIDADGVAWVEFDGAKVRRADYEAARLMRVAMDPLPFTAERFYEACAAWRDRVLSERVAGEVVATTGDALLERITALERWRGEVDRKLAQGEWRPLV